MFTFAVIACNRLHYLKNCVKSIIEFVGLSDINLLVIDNASIESGVHEYLSSLSPEVDVKVFKKRHPNELHRAMNYAIEYSRKRKNKYVNFIQDDYQYLYHQPNFLSGASDAFKAHKNVVQLHTNLIWKYKKHKIGKMKPVVVNGYKWFFMYKKRPCDNGITRVSLFKRIGLYPSNVRIHGEKGKFQTGEAWLAKRCKSKYRMMSSIPNLGMMIDCAFIRKDKRFGNYFPPPKNYFLRPFSEEQQNKVKEQSGRNKFCFIEDMIATDGWTPHNIQKHGTQKGKRVT